MPLLTAARPPEPRRGAPTEVGDELEHGRPGRRPGRSETERAIELAYKAVSRRERTVAELRTCLERKRVEPVAIDAAVEELTVSGFLDDTRYAVRFAEDKRDLEQWGSERIARELGRLGVDAGLIEVALCDRHQSELETAMLLLEQRFPTPPGDDRERDRAWQLLVRRGYSSELAYEAIRSHERQAGEGYRAA
jgi:regulatory protein